jgi:hypothetical protein
MRIEQTGASSGYLQALCDAVSSEAARLNTQSAVAAVLLRDIPEGALQIMLFDTWRARAVEASPLLDSFGASIVIGVAAGAIAAIVTTPFDLVVSNLAAVKPGSAWEGLVRPSQPAAKAPLSQLRSTATSVAPGRAGAGRASGCGPFEVMRDIVVRDGWSGLMKGAGHRAAYYGPIAGIFFTCFTALQDLVVDEGRLAYIATSLTPAFHLAHL